VLAAHMLLTYCLNVYIQIQRGFFCPKVPTAHSAMFPHMLLTYCLNVYIQIQRGFFCPKVPTAHSAMFPLHILPCLIPTSEPIPF